MGRGWLKKKLSMTETKMNFNIVVTLTLILELLTIYIRLPGTREGVKRSYDFPPHALLLLASVAPEA